MSVTLESLHYYNGFTYRECYVPLARQGLVYLSGRNGAGKSTPFEVLQHTLFGTTSRGVKKDGVVCAIPGTDGFLAELIVQNPDGRWLIRQARNHSVHKTCVRVLKEVDGKWSARWEGGGCPKKLEDAQRLAGSLIGLQPHEFGGCMYLSQATGHTLIEGTPSEKMRYVAQLFGLDVYDRMVTYLKEELKAASAEVAEVPGLEAVLAERREEAERYDAPRPEDLAVLQHAVDAADQQRRILNDLIYDGRDALASVVEREALQKQRDAIGQVGKPQDLRARAERLKAKREVLRESVRVAAERQRLEAELDALPPVDRSPEELAAEVEEARVQEREALATVTALRQRARAEEALRELDYGHRDAPQVREALDRARTAEATAKGALGQRQREMAEITTDLTRTVCPTCRQTMDPAVITQAADRLNNEIGELQATVDRAAQQRVALARRYESAVRYEELARELDGLPEGEVDAASAALAAVSRRILALDRGRTAATERRAVQRRLAALSRPNEEVAAWRLQRTETLLGAVEEELERAAAAGVLDRQLARHERFDPALTRRTVGLAEEALDRLQEGERDVRDRLVRTQVAADDYADLRAAVQDLEQRLALLDGPRQRVHVLTYGVAAVQKLKRRKLHRVVQSIRDCLPRFASIMFSHEPRTRFVVASDDESLDLIARREVDGVPVDVAVKSFSGGEKQRLSVALVFTLHALLHERKRPDLLILDEVDRGLDEVGIASLMSLVRGVRERYGTVIMTSHRAQIAGAAFDRTWTVVKHNEESRLTTDGSTGC